MGIPTPLGTRFGLCGHFSRAPQEPGLLEEIPPGHSVCGTSPRGSPGSPARGPPARAAPLTAAPRCGRARAGCGRESPTRSHSPAPPAGAAAEQPRSCPRDRGADGRRRPEAASFVTRSQKGGEPVPAATIRPSAFRF